MKEYIIYCIRDEFAEHYFYKADILSRFFKSHHENRFQQDLALQFDYITHDFPQDITFHILSQLRNVGSIKIFKNDNQLDIYSNNHYISLYIHKKQLKLICHSLYDAENLLFPALRSYHPYLFIVDTYFQEFGWISPEKNNFKSEEGKQLLYSIL